jgi:hypothetical protein
MAPLRFAHLWRELGPEAAGGEDGGAAGAPSGP